MSNKKRANLELELPIETQKELILSLYAVMNCYDVFRELRSRGFPYRQQVVSRYIKDLGVMRKKGKIIKAKHRRDCKLCSDSYEPRSSRQIYCEVCVPHRDRAALTAAVKFGMSRAQLSAILNQQQNACAICQIPFVGKGSQCIDHCHVTGRVRGVLCPKCNFAIGLMGDKPDVLRSAAKYLESNS